MQKGAIITGKIENGYISAAENVDILIARYSALLSDEKIDDMLCQKDAYNFVGSIGNKFLNCIYDTGIFFMNCKGLLLMALDVAGTDEEQVEKIMGAINSLERTPAIETINYLNEYTLGKMAE